MKVENNTSQVANKSGTTTPKVLQKYLVGIKLNFFKLYFHNFKQLLYLRYYVIGHINGSVPAADVLKADLELSESGSDSDI